MKFLAGERLGGSLIHSMSRKEFSDLIPVAAVAIVALVQDVHYRLLAHDLVLYLNGHEHIVFVLADGRFVARPKLQFVFAYCNLKNLRKNSSVSAITL